MKVKQLKYCCAHKSKVSSSEKWVIRYTLQQKTQDTQFSYQYSFNVTFAMDIWSEVP